MRCTKCDYPLWNLSTPRCPECGQAFSLREFWFQPGTVAFACPYCGERHPGWGPLYLPMPPKGRCQACGEPVDRLAMMVVPLTDDVSKAEAIPRWSVPWEFRHELGVWRAWWQTFVLSVRRPGEMGRRLVRFAATDAVMYAVFAHLICFVGGVLLHAASTAVDSLMHGRNLWVALGPVVCWLGSAVFAAFAWPVCTTFVYGSVMHGLLWVLGARERKIDVTITCIFYAQGPLAFAGIAAVSPIVALLLVPLVATVLVLMIIILARAHGITIWESASAVVGAPVVVMMLVMALGYLLN